MKNIIFNALRFPLGFCLSWADLVFLQVLKSPSPAQKETFCLLSMESITVKLGCVKVLSSFYCRHIKNPRGYKLSIKKKKSIKKSKKIFFLMGTLNFWEVNDNHIPTAITVLLNHFKLYFFTGRKISEKKEKNSQFFKVSFVIFMLQMDGRQFWICCRHICYIESFLCY